MRRALAGFAAVFLLWTAAAAAPAVQAEGNFVPVTPLSAQCGETAMGNLCADAARAALNCDLAVICGGALVGAPDSGAVYLSDVDGWLDGPVALGTARITAPELKTLLEYGISFLTLGGDDRIDEAASAFPGFPQVSGFTWKYDVSAPIGQRVLWIRFNGELLDLEDASLTLTLTAPLSLLRGDFGGTPLSCQNAGLTLQAALNTYLTACEIITPELGRGQVIGAGQALVDALPAAAVVLACFCIGGLSALVGRKHDRNFTFKG